MASSREYLGSYMTRHVAPFLPFVRSGFCVLIFSMYPHWHSLFIACDTACCDTPSMFANVCWLTQSVDPFCAFECAQHSDSMRNVLGYLCILVSPYALPGMMMYGAGACMWPWPSGASLRTQGERSDFSITVPLRRLSLRRFFLAHRPCLL